MSVVVAVITAVATVLGVNALVQLHYNDAVAIVIVATVATFITFLHGVVVVNVVDRRYRRRVV